MKANLRNRNQSFRRKFVASLVFAVLALSWSAFAQNSVQIGSLPLPIPASGSGTVYYIYSENPNSLLSPGSPANFNVSISQDAGNTLNLTFNNLTVSKSRTFSSSTGSNVGINFNGLTVLTLMGNNTLNLSDTNTGWSLASLYSLKIGGKGNLNIATGNGDYSFGVVSSQSLTIDIDGTLTSETGSATTNNGCVYASDELNITGKSNVIAKAANASGFSTGLTSVSSSLNIDTKGFVKAIAGNSSYNFSFGIYSGTQPTISAGNVLAQGRTSSFYKIPNLDNYVKPIIVASQDFDGINQVTYNPSDAATYKYFHIYTIRNLSEAVVSLSGSSFEVTGSAIEPKVVSVVLDDRTLVEGTDYEVTYGANDKVGTGTVTITGKGYYEGSQTVTFSIETRKYTVTLPSVKNAATNPAAGSFRVEEGKDFGFTVAPDKGFVAKVTTDQGETLYPYDGNRYLIVGLKWDTRVYIEVLKATAADGIETLSVRSKDGNVYIASPKKEKMTIFNIDGQVIKSQPIPAGTTVIGGLSAGVYLVRIGSTTAKVVVR